MASPRQGAEEKRQSGEVRAELRRRQRAEAPTPEEREAERAATGFYAILAEEENEPDANSASRTTVDLRSLCELMSEQAQAQTVRYAEVASGVAREWDCEDAVGLLVLRSKRAGGFAGGRAEVIAVNAVGGRATATVRIGEGPITSLPLVKEDGEWKLGPNSISAPR